MAEQDTQNTQDTEITLGAGRLLGLFFGLVVLCALFFVVGYRLGRSSTVSPAQLTDSAAPPEPSSPAVKHSASQSAMVIKSDCASTPAGCAGAGDSTAAAGADNSGATAPPVLPVATTTQSSTPAAPEISKPEVQSGYIVQVAAVTKQQDAEALVAALKKKQYPVFIVTPTTDNLFHVQIGPFGDARDAESIRSRLVSDGYNPIVKR
jgi:cell division septation protein DedD